MRLDRLSEDLDDKDQFAEYCPICDLHETMTDIDVFHTAHEEAAQQANRAKTDDPMAMTQAWWKLFTIEMGKRGFVREKGSWVNVGAIREDLDDKDIFTKDCDICERNENATGKQNPPDFHIAHYAAEDAINRAIAYMVTWTSGPEVATRIFDAEMSTMRKYGYVVKATDSQGYKIWVKPSLKEALDDKDTFVPKGGGCYFCGNDYNLDWIQTEDGGRRHSWFLCQYCREDPELQQYVVKEDLDDKDEFSSLKCGGGCPLSAFPNNWYNKFNRDSDFHDAHMAALAAMMEIPTESESYNSAYRKKCAAAIAKMREFGYELTEPMSISGFNDMRKSPIENWYFSKSPIKEDLDDKDEFSQGGNVHHRQAWDSNENLQHWLITMWDMNPARRIYASDNIRIEGEYYVRGGKAGGMSVTTNTSNVDENTAERMLQAASSVGIGTYDVDWDEAAANAQNIT